MHTATIEKIEETFVSRMHAVIVDRKTSFSETASEYDQIESETVAQLRENGANHLVLPIQREVAVARLSAALDKSTDFETARELFRRASQLGFRTAGDRVVATGIFGRICLAHGHGALVAADFEQALLEAGPGMSNDARQLNLLRELKVSSYGAS